MTKFLFIVAVWARLHLLTQITPWQSSPVGFAWLRHWLAKAKSRRSRDEDWWNRRRSLKLTKYAQKSDFSFLTSFRIARYCTPYHRPAFFRRWGKNGVFRPFMGKKWGSVLNANEPSPRPGVQPSSLLIRRHDTIPPTPPFCKSGIRLFFLFYRESNRYIQSTKQCSEPHYFMKKYFRHLKLASKIKGRPFRNARKSTISNRYENT